MQGYLIAFTVLWLWRYTRLIVNCISSWTFKPTPLPVNPTYKSPDVTVIIPTIASGDGLSEFARCLTAAIKSGPAGTLVVTPERCHTDVSGVIKQVLAQKPLRGNKVTLLLSKVANKRQQLCVAIPRVKTSIIVLADDDVVWPQNLLPHILAPFEDPKVGGVGTNQRILYSANPGVWEYLNACYIERRNFEISATSHIDGGVSCLSGRTVAYRTEILKTPEFLHGFANEQFLGKTLNADDDNFITRFLVARQWGIRIQFCPESEVLTTLDQGRKYLSQCLRWARSNWRSNTTSMVSERYIWRQQPWCAYALHLGMLQHSLLTDPILATLLYRSLAGSANRTTVMWAFAFWLLLTKTVKLIPHFYRYPRDLRYIPVTVLFGYFHGFIKLYALLTVGSMSWGSKKTDDDKPEKPETQRKRSITKPTEGMEHSEEAQCLYASARANAAAGPSFR